MKAKTLVIIKLTLKNFHQHQFEMRQNSWEDVSCEDKQRSERKLGLWGLAPEKNLRSCSCECWKMPCYTARFELFSSLIFMLRKET